MKEERQRPGGGPLPARPIERLTSPLEHFLHIEASSGIVLLGCTLIALALANSAWAPAYQAFWEQRLRVGVGDLGLDYPLWYWVNDGLMTLFFFVIGLEIKRERVHGELADTSKLIVPVAAALGGALVPVAIFLGLQRGQPGQVAWGVPMATDIAFVVGCLSVLGGRVPRSLKLLLLSLAIVDDILAVLVIAIFYSSGLQPLLLVWAAVLFGLVVLLNRLGVRTVTVYVIVGAGIWLCFLKSGVHPTVAGVLLGLFTPASAWLGDASLREVLAGSAGVLGGGEGAAPDAAARRSVLMRLHFAAREATSPLARLETALHPWVGFFIMPVFALANAGVTVSAETLTGPLALAVAAGLTLGKPAGILAASWLAAKLGKVRLPDGISWGALLGGGCLAGIGFTMSLFVASLGLEGGLLQEAKGGVLLGSGASLVLGVCLLLATLRPPRSSP